MYTHTRKDREQTDRQRQPHIRTQIESKHTQTDRQIERERERERGEMRNNDTMNAQTSYLKPSTHKKEELQQMNDLETVTFLPMSDFLLSYQ